MSIAAVSAWRHRAQREIPGRLCAGGLHPDRRNPQYNPGSASYGGVAPANPFSWTGGGWGAWEIAGRVSTMDLNDQLGAANGVAGGRQTVYTAALNWYVNRNIRFMFDYLHGDVARQINATNPGNAGSKFNAVAMRTQLAFSSFNSRETEPKLEFWY